MKTPVLQAVSLAISTFVLLTTPAAFAQSEAIASTGELTDGQRVVLITGSNSGLGREVALQLAAAGDHVIVHGRNVERGVEVIDEIASLAGSARFYRADFGSLEQIRHFADQINADYPRLDVLVNNAGIGSSVPEGRQVSEDGHELRFQVNYLAGYLLTHRLLPLIRRSAPARIVNVASIAQTPIDFDNVMLEQNYSGSRAYGQSKLAQILFTVDLAAELEGQDIQAVALHPATYMDTPMVTEAGGRPMNTVEEGAEAVLNLINSESVENGAFYNRLRVSRANAQAADAEARRRLRELSENLTGE